MKLNDAFESWCLRHGQYLNDSDTAARSAKLLARAAWDAGSAAERTRQSRYDFMRLGDPEMRPVMDDLKRRIKDEPGFGASLLYAAGIINADGTLSENYGGSAPNKQEAST